jgi:hypothetical protein
VHPDNAAHPDARASAAPFKGPWARAGGCGRSVGHRHRTRLHFTCSSLANAHCGNITFDLEWQGDPPEIPARACGCSFCVKHGGVLDVQSEFRLAVAVSDNTLVSSTPSELGPPRFVCSRCGTVPLVTSEIEKRLYAVVNINAFENVDQSWIRRTTANFEGEDVELRISRRKRNWIADVRIVEAGA